MFVSVLIVMAAPAWSQQLITAEEKQWLDGFSAKFNETSAAINALSQERSEFLMQENKKLLANPDYPYDLDNMHSIASADIRPRCGVSTSGGRWNYCDVASDK